MDEQDGKVTAVSASSITVRSSDGYTTTYRVTRATFVAETEGIAAVKTGDTVLVSATVKGSKPTAQLILPSSFMSRGWRRS
jgi:hypothetical protein